LDDSRRTSINSSGANLAQSCVAGQRSFSEGALGFAMESSGLVQRQRSFSEGEAAQPIFKFVLTGGPCAGKTTALARLGGFLGERGFRVYTVPEAATLLFSNGHAFQDLALPGMELAFQLAVIRTQIHLEDTFASLARATGDKTVLLCDRGTMDGSAYVSREIFEQVLAKLGEDEITLRDGRYNAVLHLVTAAVGAEEFYTLANNQTRTESPEVAAQLDENTKNAWSGHPRQIIIDNVDLDFEAKMRALVSKVSHVVGLPSTERTTRKFEIKSVPEVGSDMWPEGLRVQVFDIEKVYLTTGDREAKPTVDASPPPPPSSGAAAAAEGGGASADTADSGHESYSFVRRRGPAGSTKAVFQQTTVLLSSGQRIETKRILTSRDYGYAVAQRADPTRHVVVQRRLTFIWRDQSFQIHQYTSPHHVAGLAVLHCNAIEHAAGADSKGAAKLELPPFLDVGAKLEDDGPKSAFMISLKRTD
jgi:predicted ATPase